MKFEKITIEFLEKFHFSSKAIDFFKINKLEGFPVSLIGEINGDYLGFIDHIREIISSKYRFDSNNNEIWIKDRYGNIYEYRYDECGNLIWEKDCYGDVYEWEYTYD